MQIDYCLILAAGFGTRMGSIGQKLPKVLWPVFEKSLLELQVAYAKSLGVKKIYINLHYMGEQIENYCKTRSAFEDVVFLWEKPEILDIGGAVHNLATQVGYKGKLLVLNADQFFYIRPEDMQKFLAPYAKNAGVLFTYNVNTSQGYNALEVDSNRVVKNIIKNADLPKNSTVETYTGISYIDLSQLTKTPGVSKFFDSVCPYMKKEIPAVLLSSVDYWDFGTVDRFWATYIHLLEVYKVQSTHPFIRFLVNEKALKTWKIDLQNLSYYSKRPKVINLTPDEDSRDLSPMIILSGKNAVKKSKPTIWWNDLCEEVKEA